MPDIQASSEPGVYYVKTAEQGVREWRASRVWLLFAPGTGALAWMQAPQGPVVAGCCLGVLERPCATREAQLVLCMAHTSTVSHDAPGFLPGVQEGWTPKLLCAHPCMRRLGSATRSTKFWERAASGGGERGGTAAL